MKQHYFDTVTRNDRLVLEMNGTFYEQIGGVAGIFDSWTVCERTVVLCALLRRVPWSNLKLIKRAIETAIVQSTTAECQRLETEANDTAVITDVMHTVDSVDLTLVDMGDKLKKLLVYLPLLKPGNDETKEMYLLAIPTIVQYCVETCKHTDECQQLLSYLLIHPGVTSQDRRSLNQWLKYLENHISGKFSKDNMWRQRIEPVVTQCKVNINLKNNSSTFRRTIGKNVEFKGSVETIINAHQPYTPPSSGDDLQQSFSKNGKDMDVSDDGERISHESTKPRSNSLTPPAPNYLYTSSSTENLNCDPHYVQKPRSFSLSSEHSLANVRNLGMMLASGSETRLDDLRSQNLSEHIGMSTVALWLKSLRLHKYIWLFSNISYQQMMNMNEEYLQELGVTKGARHKLLISIKKLADRQSVLAGMEKELCNSAVMSATTMSQLLEQVRNIILSPILPTSDIPTLTVRVLELASNRLLAGGVVQTSMNNTCLKAQEEQGNGMAATYEPVSLHCWLVDKALHHDSFSPNPDFVEKLKKLRHRLPPRQFFGHLNDLPFAKRTPKPRWRSSVTHQNSQPILQSRVTPWARDSDLLRATWRDSDVQRTSWHDSSRDSSWSRDSDVESKVSTWREPVNKSGNQGKSSSYPTFGTQPTPRPAKQKRVSVPDACNTVSASLGDINLRLESLCLQMTEKAIN